DWSSDVCSSDLPGQDVGQNAQVHKRWGADLQAIRSAAAFAVDVKSKLTFGILVGKINLAWRRIDSLSDIDEVVDQFLHSGQNALFGRQHDLRIGHIYRAVGKFIQTLMQNAHALAHFFDAQQVAIVTVSHRSHWDIKLQLIVN